MSRTDMPPLVFLHGWGQSSRIWQGQLDRFSHLAPVQAIDLPGHGSAIDAPPEAWLDTLAAQLPERPSILVGWSLGGMLALGLADKFRERVAGLALVSTTPCFNERPDWPHGCPSPIFQAFEKSVSGESSRQLGRFFALMLQGDDLPRSYFNTLAREAVDKEHPPTAAGLKGGLSLLATLDLRPLLAGLKHPAWVAHGDRDAIVPQAAGQYLADALPQATWHTFEHCGHAPFLTRAKTFNDGLEAWCRNISHANG